MGTVMRNLLYKEWKLAMQPATIVFEFLAFMVLIPTYPYFITFFYATLGVFFICMFGRDNRDVEYTALLPVNRRSIVGSRVWMSVFVELAQVALAAALCAAVRPGLHYASNAAGMNPNAAFFGFALLLLGLFNATFFPMYYRNTEKIGVPFLVASIVYAAAMLAVEVLVMAPVSPLHALIGYEADLAGMRAAVLVAGAAAYCVLTWSACRSSVKRFQNEDIA